MTINAKLVPSASTVVLRKAPDGGLQQSSTPVTLKNSTIAAGRRLDSLVDVVADTAQTEAGSTLVYDPITDTYVVKMLDINGGTF